MNLRALDDRLVGLTEAAAARFVPRGLTAPVLMREVIGAFAATASIHLVASLIDYPIAGLMLGFIITLIARSTYREWRFHDNASRLEWDAKLAASYRAIAMSRRETWWGIRLGSIVLVLLGIGLTLRDAFSGTEIQTCELTGLIFILVAIGRLYVECIALLDPDNRIHEPEAVPHAA